MGQTTPRRGDGDLRVLIAGGGVAGLEAMLTLRELAGELVSLELLSPEHHFWYRPLSVAEPFDGAPTPHFELARIAASAGASFTPGTLVAIDADAHVAYTSRGTELAYDVLVVACGTRSLEALDGALTFRGPSDTERFLALLGEIERGEVASVVFAQPRRAGWSLPLYELALLTATHVARSGVTVKIDVVTHEPAPLSLFGSEAAAAVADLLRKHGIALHTGLHPLSYADGWLELDEERVLPADRVVALPRLEGHRVQGLPCDPDGFVRVDRHGRVDELVDVYAAGDVTQFPIKQGGIAAQQAEIVGEAIAAIVRPELEPHPREHLAYAVLLTGGEPLYLRADLTAGYDAATTLASEPLFWPPSKIAARHLAPFLAELETAEQLSKR